MAVGRQEVGEDPGGLLEFSALEEDTGVVIADNIERRRCVLLTPEPVFFSEERKDQFVFPVDKAISVETNRVQIPERSVVCVRNSMGWMIDELSKGDKKSYPKDSYSLELPLHVKLYLQFNAGCSINVKDRSVEIRLDSDEKIEIGARSHHKHPAGRVITTPDEEDLMWAISQLSSALKTTSCERSYPTLRGHPPLVQIGDRRDCEKVIQAPSTGVTIEVPPKISNIFIGAPLSFYLGADMVPGDRPRITTSEGFSHDLSGVEKEYEEEVERVLKQVFFLDCITRTEGLYQMDLSERSAIEGLVEYDFADLYDQPLSIQLERYLSTPWDMVKRNVPDWKLTAQITPSLKHVQTIPFVLNDLAIIKMPKARSSLTPEGQSSSTNLNQIHWNEPATVKEPPSAPELLRIKESESMEQTWIGEGAPVGASKGMVEAFKNRLDRTPNDNSIDITVVCNDSQMGEEKDIVNEIYGSRGDLPFDVTAYRELSRYELKDVLKSKTDLFHYIGHIDNNGFECTDSPLDISEIEDTGVEAFFLNACSSYEQGKRLIAAGATAGVVTLQDVINSGAERVGNTMARLLNQGFPLRAALNIAKEESIMGGHYLVIGDGSIDIAQSSGSFPAICHINETRQSWVLGYESFLTQEKGMGSVIIPFVNENESYYLASGMNDEYVLEKNALIDFLSIEDMPVMYENELRWSDEVVQKLRDF